MSDEAVTRHVAKWIDLHVLLWDPNDKTVYFAHALTDDFEAPIRAAAEKLDAVQLAHRLASERARGR